MRALLRFWPDIRARLWVYSLVMVLTLIANAISLATPMLTGHIIDGPIAHRDPAGLWWPAAAILAVGIAEASALWARRRMVAGVVSEWEVTWRGRLFSRLLYLRVGRHDAWDSGQLLSRATQDMSQLRRFFAFGGPFMLVTPVTIVIGTVMLWLIHPLFGLTVIGMAIPLTGAIALLEGRYRRTSRASQDTMGEITTNVEESILGIRILRSFGRSSWASQRFSELSHRLAGCEVHLAKLDSWMWATMLMLPAAAQVVMLGLGAWGVLEGWVTIGQVVAALTITWILRMPIEMLGFLLADFLISITAAQRYWEVLDEEIGIEDPTGGIDDAAAVPSAEGRLEFADVGFTFDDGESPLLHDVNLTVEPGETLALVGPTGSGKSTVVSLIPRLHDVTSGAITIDGRDIRAIPLNSLRGLVSFAFEDPILFSDTIRANVEMGAPGAGDDEIEQALRIAAAWDFVQDLPEGLETQVGEQGLSLSGGQRQRVALARAIIGKPRVLVMDDPLSAVDVDTEDRVQRALAEVLPDSTTIVVAHRPSTALLADRVAVLDGGTVVETGTHRELTAHSTTYRNLMGAQV